MAKQTFDSAALALKEAQARDLHSAMRVPEAVELLREVLAARLEFQGEKHFQTINARSSLARSLRAIHQDKLGPEHPQTLRSLSRLANT
ncbi:MAG: hypothetical protein J4N87_02655, partial [Chloroflexi bacterium]|nr:hypothetical protein [Chloroflexota bacterium]